jgi:hypothetical protein
MSPLGQTETRAHRRGMSVLPPGADTSMTGRFAPEAVGREYPPQAAVQWPLCADCVEKLENRAAPKISQMQRIDDFSRCNAL